MAAASDAGQPPPPLPPAPGPQHHRHYSSVDMIDIPSPQLDSRLHGLDAEDFHSEQRTTRMRPAVFSLVNTVVGGGTLSLAYSFHAAGTLVGSLLLALICLATDFTLFALISASRRTGAKSYEGVMLAAFGRPAQVACTILIFVITFLTPAAYLILLRGLLTPIIEAYLLSSTPLSPLAKHLLIGGIALAVTPFSASSMGAIGSLAVLSMASIAVLAAVVGVRGYQCMLEKGNPDLPAVGRDGFNILTSIPIYVASFLCHFNVLPVYAELRRPTRERAHSVVHFTMATTLALYLFVGLVGYAYAECRSGAVPDNLLNAFPPNDPLVNVARAALAVVLCFCFPLLLMPCRDSCLRLLGMLFGGLVPPHSSTKASASSPSMRTPLLGAHEDSGGADRGGHQPSSSEAYGAMQDGDRAEHRPVASSVSLSGPTATNGSIDSSSSSSPPRQRRQASCWQRMLLTYLLVVAILALATALDSVALVWAVIGSFGCITVGLVFPPAAYLKVGCRQQRGKRLWAWVILLSGCVLLVLCATQTVFALLAA